MPVERNKDGSISIKISSNNGTVAAAAIGKIVAATDNKQEENFHRWVEHCAESVNACAHTLEETEQYFLQNCDALSLAPDDRRMKNFQLNVVMNYCKDKLKHQAPEFSFDMTDDEIESWYKEEDAMRQEAMSLSPEHFGLNIRGYYLPHTEHNAIFYEQAYHKAQKWIRQTNPKADKIEMQDICFFFEETTEHCQCSGGGNSLMQQLIAFRGVSADDIEKRSPRYLIYISTLRDMGIIPDFLKE